MVQESGQPELETNTSKYFLQLLRGSLKEYRAILSSIWLAIVVFAIVHQAGMQLLMVFDSVVWQGVVVTVMLLILLYCFSFAVIQSHAVLSQQKMSLITAAVLTAKRYQKIVLAGIGYFGINAGIAYGGQALSRYMYTNIDAQWLDLSVSLGVGAIMLVWLVGAMLWVPRIVLKPESGLFAAFAKTSNWVWKEYVVVFWLFVLYLVLYVVLSSRLFLLPILLDTQLVIVLEMVLLAVFTPALLSLTLYFIKRIDCE